MGYAITPFAVDLKQVSGAIGSKNKRLISELVEKFGNVFDQYDEMAEDMLEDMEDEDGEPLRMEEAITQLVMGKKRNEEFGFMYGYALEFICWHFGDHLSNQQWSAMPSGAAYVEEVDKALQAAGVNEKVLSMSTLIYRGSPVKLPMIEDAPCIGYMRLPEIEAALKSFGEKELAAVKDKEIRSSLAELQGWLEACATTKRDLVCFYA